MSSRISKRPSKSRDILKSTASKLISAVSAEGFEVPVSTANALVLAAAIEEFGFEVMPCSRCIAHGRVCKMLDNGSKKCGFCTDKGRPCDGTGVPLHSLTRVISEAKRLGDKESELEEEFLKKRAALRAAQAEFDQSLDLLERARRQRQSLVTRGREMTRRGLESLEELEASEQAELEATIDVRSLVYADVIDWPSLGFGDGSASANSLLLDPSLPSPSGVGENSSGGVVHG